MYFEFFELKSWGKRSANNRRRFNLRLLKRNKARFKEKKGSMENFKIFIASSLDDLQSERSELVNFIFEMNKKLKKRYGVEIEPVYCEAKDHQYTKERMQDVFNKDLQNSDLAVFMFYHDAGKFTLEEFDVATKAYSQVKAPVIYVFFKKPNEGDEVTSKLVDFKKDLHNTHGHYPENFMHVDTIKLRIILCLQTLLKDLPQVSAENGSLMIGDTEVISLDNVSEFSNNSALQSLRRELEEIERQYSQAKLLYQKNDIPELKQNYEQLKLKREKIAKLIYDLQKNIFEMSLNMCRDSVHGKISSRQKEAYKAFESGDYDGCIAILSQEDLDTDFEVTEKQLAELQIQNASKYISEQTMAIKILQLMVNDPNRHKRIDERFRKILPVAHKYRIKPFVAYYYASFLFTQRRYKESSQLLDDLKRFFIEGNATINPLQLAKLYNLLGSSYYLTGNIEAARDSFCQTRKLGIQIEQDPNVTNTTGSGLGRVYNNLAIMDWLAGETEKAEALFRDAMERFKKMVQIDRIYTADVASIMKSLGFFYTVTDRLAEAEDMLDDALEQYTSCLAFDDEYIINAKIAETYCAQGVLFLKNDRCGKAERQLQKALTKIENLSEIYPGYYDYDLAAVYSGLAEVYSKYGNIPKMQEHLEKARTLLEKLHKETPEVYQKELAWVQDMQNREEISWSDSLVLHRYIVNFFY